MGPYLPKGTTENDIQPFPWEDKIIAEMSEKDKLQALEDQQASEEFWSDWDKRVEGKA